MKFSKGFRLCFCIYELLYGIACIVEKRGVSPIVFTLVVMILLIDVACDALENYAKEHKNGKV